MVAVRVLLVSLSIGVAFGLVAVAFVDDPEQAVAVGAGVALLMAVTLQVGRGVVRGVIEESQKVPSKRWKRGGVTCRGVVLFGFAKSTLSTP